MARLDICFAFLFLTGAMAFGQAAWAQQQDKNEAEPEKFYMYMGRTPDEIPQDRDRGSPNKIETIHVAENVYMLAGGFGNIGVCVSDEGVLLIDDAFPEVTPSVLAAVRELSDKPIRYLVNTHWHWDHAGGNENMADQGALIIAHEDVMQWMTTWQISGRAGTPKAPQKPMGLPKILFDSQITLRMGSCTLTATRLPPAHTAGDIFIHFTEAGVYHTGDVYTNGSYPFIDINTGGSITGLVEALDQILAQVEPDTIIIPGHGRLSNGAELKAHRDIVATIRDRVQAAIDDGKTREEAVAMGLTKDFDDELWTPYVTGEVLVITSYASLVAGN